MKTNGKNEKRNTAVYATGNKTRNRILAESRKLFYKKGLKDTTYDDISSSLAINRALIPYYFDSKYELGWEVYSMVIDEFMEKIDTHVLKDAGVEQGMLFDTARVFAYYRFFQNAKFAKFAAQIFENESYITQTVNLEQKFISGYAQSKRKCSEEEIHRLAHMDYGMEREVIRLANQRKGELDTDAFFNIELRLLLLYCGYTDKQIREVAEESLQVLSQYEVTIRSGFKMRIQKLA